jgi:hypothetical protein
MNEASKVVPPSGKRKPPNAGKGRVKGVPNKVTTEFRETVRRVLEENSTNVGTWLAQVADGHGEVKPAPDKALDLLAKLAEFAAPKLARTEISGVDGDDIKHSVKVTFE